MYLLGVELVEHLVAATDMIYSWTFGAMFFLAPHKTKGENCPISSTEIYLKLRFPQERISPRNMHVYNLS